MSENADVQSSEESEKNEEHFKNTNANKSTIETEEISQSEASEKQVEAEEETSEAEQEIIDGDIEEKQELSEEHEKEISNKEEIDVQNLQDEQLEYKEEDSVSVKEEDKEEEEKVDEAENNKVEEYDVEKDVSEDEKSIEEEAEHQDKGNIDNADNLIHKLKREENEQFNEGQDNTVQEQDEKEEEAQEYGHEQNEVVNKDDEAIEKEENNFPNNDDEGIELEQDGISLQEDNDQYELEYKGEEGEENNLVESKGLHEDLGEGEDNSGLVMKEGHQQEEADEAKYQTEGSPTGAKLGEDCQIDSQNIFGILNKINFPQSLHISTESNIKGPDYEHVAEVKGEVENDQQEDSYFEASHRSTQHDMDLDVDQFSSSLYDKHIYDENKNAHISPSNSVSNPGNLPTPARSYTNIEGQMSTSALNIVWSFGLNRNVPVLNLSDGVRQAIMYPCAHVGIMYDYKNNKQHILQAHLNPITCSAVSQDKRWLVTGDVGPDAMVNIWDTYTGTPIQTMFDPNPKGGVVAVALTPDSRYLATLSALPIQTLAIWDWTVDGDVPICSADLKPAYGLQNFIYFDPTDVHHLVTNSETQVLFYHWEDAAIKYYAPPLSDNDFNKPVGRYSQSLFQIGIARALTATSIGNLVVWDNNRPLSKIMDVNQSADKKPLKIIKVHDKGINVLTNTDQYIVIGDTAGHIKFYDQGLRLIYWYQDFHSGPCTAISFAHMPDFVNVATENSKYPSDATKQAKPFVIRDFIVGTAIAVYCSINTDGSKLRVIHREHDAAVHALAAHPQLPIVAIGSYSGLLKLWNYRTKEVVASKMIEKHHIQCCAFDPKGFNIALGCTNGALFLVDSVALLDQFKEPFKYARDPITHLAFSHNSTYLATADAGFTITVYKRQRKEGRSPYIWHGRYRSHYKPIKDLLFEIHLDTNQPKLLSLGEDRMLIEYDLHHFGKTNKVVPIAFDRIEQAAIPQCMTKYPPITKEHFFLTANDQYKLKCYNSTTKMCRKTVLGPTYGSPIRKMMVVPTDKDESKNRFLAYITDDKIGLQFLPATGNPHLAMALIAHPSGVSNLTCSFDGAYLFTAGGPDFAVHMWEINIAALHAQAKLGGEDLVPFYGLLEGGRDGELFAELEDLFYYAQLRHQGINSMDTRQISNRVPLTEVPYIMRAMGFYPSEQEIEDMLNEIKYNEYVNLGHYQEDIDLGGFIKLYVNHRPAFGLSAEKLLWAFQTLSETQSVVSGGVIERGDFFNLLEKKGEHMTEEELSEHLTTLLGFNKEGGACEDEPFEPEKGVSFIGDALPFDINSEILINEILGFSMTVDPPAKIDTKDVVKSGAS